MTKVYVKYKKGIIDPEAENTEKALRALGYEVNNVTIWKVYELDTEEDVEEMVERLLVNPVIHEYRIE
ncbi:MAG: phosphoribosylformylglycinamidine synthase subunit PurS [Euryarchaeota archaeon]|nr:phosphoribosylformylglycinamidine synthase subunit PurS [Euryarchaeota archaeon]